MAVIETKKEKQDMRAVLLIGVLLLGMIALGGVVYWMLKPVAPRQVTLTPEQAKEAGVTDSGAARTPLPNLPPAPPLPQAQDPGATLVSLDLKQATVRQALAEVLKQSKSNLRANVPDGGGILATLMTPRSDIAIKEQPFWSAVMDLCKKGQLSPSTDWNAPNQISFQQGGDGNLMAAPSKAVGSCLIVLESVASSFNADLVGTRAPGRDLLVNMRLFVEPKLSPYRISGAATIETAVDEKGTNLVRPRDRWDDQDRGGPKANWMKQVQARLNFPADAGEKIATLKGYVSIVVAGPDQTQKIDNPLAAKNVDTKVDGVTVHLIEVLKQGPTGYEVRMAGDTNVPIFKEFDQFSKIVSMVDASGKEFQRNGGNWGGGRGTTMEFGINFTAPSAASSPKELRVTLPSQLKEIRVPFEFNDLVLPH